MNDAARKLEDLEWVGGHPALDFVNTVNCWHGEEPGAEYLASYGDLLRWHRMANLVGPQGSRALCRGSTAENDAALGSAIVLRDSLHRLFRAVAGGSPLPQRALDHLNVVVKKTVAWRRLAAEGRRISCGWDFTGAPPDALLGPVAWQAAELLEHGSLERIKECPSEEGCGWLFLDLSKNRSRSWCSMKTCGNSAKVKRFRSRQQQK